MSSKLFGNDWARDISRLLDNPDSFISETRKPAESLIEEMMIILSSASTNLALKLAILHALQNVDSFLSNQTLQLKILSSLEDLAYQFVDQADNLFIHQLLAALTVFSIEVEERLIKDGVHLSKCVDLLLAQVSQVADGSRFDRVLLRGAACNCLSEMEAVYPGLLHSKLCFIFQYCQLEKTFVRQHYLSLFSDILRHSLLKLHTVDLEDHATRLTYFFSPTSELLPFIIPDKFREESTELLSYSLSCVLNTSLDKVDLKKAISTVLDASNNMSPTILALIMHQLSDSVVLAGLPPSLLKTLFHRYLHSSSIVLLQLMYSLRLKFGRELFDVQDQTDLERSIFWALNNPLNLNPHTLLIYSWLTEFPILDPLTRREDRGLPLSVPLSQLCYPTPSDSVDLSVRCFQLFSISDLILEETHSINTHLAVLMRRVKSQPGSLATAAFFHVLFLFLQRTQSQSMVQSVKTILTDLYLSYPQLAPYLINFITCVNKLVPPAEFAVPVLSGLVGHLQTVEQVAPADLSHHLRVLEHAALTPQVGLEAILQLLHSLLHPDLCEEGDWRLGHAVLDLCKAILVSLRSDAQFQRACALLHRLRASFREVDVADEAGFILTLITSVSSKKYRPLLSKVAETASALSLKELVVGTTFQLASPITHIPEVFLQLQRVQVPPSPTPPAHPDLKGTLDGRNILEQYLSSIEEMTENASFKLGYHLSFAPLAKPTTSMQTIYAISLYMSGSPYYHPTASVTVPKLVYPSKKKGETVNDKRIISFEFRPKEPLPATFSVSAIFSLPEGSTFQTPLAPLEVSFADILRPASLPECLNRIHLPALFDALWDHFSSRCFSEHNLESRCTESFMKFHKPRESISLTFHQTLAQNVVTSSEEAMQLLFFLPPRNHILLRARLSPNSTDMRILTDDWKLLSHLNHFLHALSAKM